MSSVTRTPVNRCLNCRKKINAASPVDPHARPPEPGDIAICLDCAHVQIYADDMTVREPTDAEIVEIAGDPEMVQAVEMIGEYNRSRGK